MIRLANGQLVFSQGVAEQDLLIDGGKIVKILDRGERAPEGTEVYDCEGKVILPGLIDAHVHFREPGDSYKEDWVTGSKAALSGGVTSVLDMPNNKPPILSCADLDMKRELIRGRSFVNYGLYIGFDGTNHQEINKAENIPGVKYYACNSTGDMGVDVGVRELFEGCNKLIVVHAEDEEIIKENKKKYLDGRPEADLTADLHSKVRSPEAAAVMTEHLCALAKATSQRMHIAHMSTGKELEILDKYRDCKITCEVAPHHLLFSDNDYEYLGSKIRMNPPVRSSADLFALWKGIKFGEVDIIATDHAPHTVEEKAESYFKVPSGVPGVEMLLPILLNTVNDEGLTLEEIVKLCCERPAEIFGIRNKGKLEIGYDADIVVVDMNLERTMRDENVISKCGWSPYSGTKFKGWPMMTFVNGKLSFKDGEVIGQANGQELAFLI